MAVLRDLFGIRSAWPLWMLCLLFCVARGFGQSSAAGSIPVAKYTSVGINLREWLVVGPFGARGDEDIWERDFFSHSVAEAKGASLESFTAFAENSSSSFLAGRGVARALEVRNSDFIDFLNLFERPYTPAAPMAVYAGCRVECPGELGALLMIGSADGIKVWLNGELVESQPSRRGVNTYDDAIPIKLRRGLNFLLVKVVRWRIPWGLTVRLEPDLETSALTALRGQGMMQSLLLKRSVLARGEALEIAPRGVSPNVRLSVSISDQSRNVGSADGLKWLPAPSLPDGIYRASVHLGDEVFIESFCIGDPAELAQRLLKRAGRSSDGGRAAMNLDALQRRLAILCEPENRQFKSDGERYAWERKTVWTLRELEGILDALEHGREAFRGVPGLHIRAFRSRIDDTEQHYRLFVPKSYNPSGRGLPLAILLPTVLSASRPFIASPFIAAHSEAERMAFLAEKYDMAILWPGYRNRPVGAPSEVTHFEEALEAVSRDYKIDPTRISMFGACSGGSLATRWALRWPERFAAIGLLNPVFGLTKNLSAENIFAFLKSDRFRAWAYESDVVSSFLDLKDLPVFIIHDGAEPGHGDLAISQDFAQRANARKFPVKFERSAQTTAQHYGAWEDLIHWLSLQRRPAASSRRDERLFATANYTGAVANVFAGRFVVVEGTGGSDKERRATRAAVQKFQDAWQQTHYGPCRVVTDVEFVESRYADSNLILFGNAEINSVWARVAPSLPVSIDRTRVQLREREWREGNLSIQAAFPYPDKSNRHIVLIGAGDMADAQFGPMNLSTEGWFTFAVWKNEKGAAQMVAADVW